MQDLIYTYSYYVPTKALNQANIGTLAAFLEYITELKMLSIDGMLQLYHTLFDLMGFRGWAHR